MPEKDKLVKSKDRHLHAQVLEAICNYTRDNPKEPFTITDIAGIAALPHKSIHKIILGKPHSADRHKSFFTGNLVKRENLEEQQPPIWTLTTHRNQLLNGFFGLWLSTPEEFSLFTKLSAYPTIEKDTQTCQEFELGWLFHKTHLVVKKALKFLYAFIIQREINDFSWEEFLEGYPDKEEISPAKAKELFTVLKRCGFVRHFFINNQERFVVITSLNAFLQCFLTEEQITLFNKTPIDSSSSEKQNKVEPARKKSKLEPIRQEKNISSHLEHLEKSDLINFFEGTPSYLSPMDEENILPFQSLTASLPIQEKEKINATQPALPSEKKSEHTNGHLKSIIFTAICELILKKKSLEEGFTIKQIINKIEEAEVFICKGWIATSHTKQISTEGVYKILKGNHKRSKSSLCAMKLVVFFDSTPNRFTLDINPKTFLSQFVGSFLPKKSSHLFSEISTYPPLKIESKLSEDAWTDSLFCKQVTSLGKSLDILYRFLKERKRKDFDFNDFKKYYQQENNLSMWETKKQLAKLTQSGLIRYFIDESNNKKWIACTSYKDIMGRFLNREQLNIFLEAMNYFYPSEEQASQGIFYIHSESDPARSEDKISEERLEPTFSFENSLEINDFIPEDFLLFPEENTENSNPALSTLDSGIIPFQIDLWPEDAAIQALQIKTVSPTSWGNHSFFTPHPTSPTLRPGKKDSAPISSINSDTLANELEEQSIPPNENLDSRLVDELMREFFPNTESLIFK